MDASSNKGEYRHCLFYPETSPTTIFRPPRMQLGICREHSLRRGLSPWSPPPGPRLRWLGRAVVGGTGGGRGSHCSIIPSMRASWRGIVSLTGPFCTRPWGGGVKGDARRAPLMACQMRASPDQARSSTPEGSSRGIYPWTRGAGGGRVAKA